MRLPDGPAVECLKGLPTTLHVLKAPHPHEALRAIEITELSDHFHSGGLLRLDELAVEEFGQHVSLAVPEGVLAKLNHRAAGGHHAVSSSPGPRHRTSIRHPTRVSEHRVRITRPASVQCRRAGPATPSGSALR